jgi:TatD DNase family protein
VLVETDSPFLAPQKLRGTDNVPGNVMLTLDEIARVRGDDVEKVVATTWDNAHDAFPDLR